MRLVPPKGKVDELLVVTLSFSDVCFRVYFSKNTSLSFFWLISNTLSIMITVRINETALEIEDTTTVHQLLQKVNTDKDGIAVAINNAIVSKNVWNSHVLLQNDNILIIKATQGG